MKLSSKVLAGSLASAGMVLSLVAPALTAQAATTSATVDDKGVVTGVTPDKTISGNLNDSKELAIAYDKDGGSGKATATSNASVKVVSGVLVLNEVPDFNFGTAVSGQTKDLVDNTKGDGTTAPGATDGNSKGNLSVLESRTIAQAADGDTPAVEGATGFNLSAQLGDFVDSEGTVAGTSAFILNLAALPITDGQDAISNSTGKALTTKAVNLESKGGAAASVMNVTTANDGTSYKDGEYLANLANVEGQKEAPASLKIADGIKSSDGSAQVKSLNAPITWTLSTDPAAK